MKTLGYLLIAVAASLSSLSNAAPALDNDGVPKVDIHGTIVESSNPKALQFAKEYGMPVPSTRMISVDGKQLPLQEFMLTYCQTKPANETCSRGHKIRSIDSTSGPRKNLPAGL